MFVGEGREKPVRPGVHADFVTGHVLFNQNGWPLNHARTNNEEGSLDIFVVEVFEKRSTKRRELDI